jgi:hypothetical protein
MGVRLRRGAIAALSTVALAAMLTGLGQSAFTVASSTVTVAEDNGAGGYGGPSVAGDGNDTGAGGHGPS